MFDEPASGVRYPIKLRSFVEIIELLLDTSSERSQQVLDKSLGLGGRSRSILSLFTLSYFKHCSQVEGLGSSCTW